MAEILLVKFDKVTVERLAEFLQRRGHCITTHSGDESLAQTLRGYSRGFDLVILDVACDEAVTRKHIAAVRAIREKRGPRPMLLCVSWVYRGPRFELELERQGARVVYVR
jgi:DNA-binding response OmpR family regulator